MFYEAAMNPADIFIRPDRPDFQPENRKCQGIASLERTRDGRLFSIFYSGQKAERNSGLACIVVSDDDCGTWLAPFITIRHHDVENMLHRAWRARVLAA